MSNIQEIYFDLETKKWSSEVEGGWNNIRAFGMALTVTWDEVNGCRTWMEGRCCNKWRGVTP